MPHLLIIGGSDAGISGALRARELAPADEVTVVCDYEKAQLPPGEWPPTGWFEDWFHRAERVRDRPRRPDAHRTPLVAASQARSG